MHRSDAEQPEHTMNSNLQRRRTLRTQMAQRSSWSVVAMLLAAAVGQALAEPSQVPLTNRAAPPPPPNVMMTIDDSGSMLSDGMPEGTFTLNGKSVTLVGGKVYWIAGFPGDTRKTAKGYQQGTVTGENNSTNVYQMQYRSPQVNSIWYDPTVQYLPWISSDGVNRMPNADYTRALWDPVLSTGNWLDLRGQTSSVTANWCTTSGNCNNTGKMFNPGLYYILTANADPTLVASYTKYDLNGPATSVYPGGPNRACAVKTACTQSEERQNFANWFTYYRMRESLTKAAVSETMASFVGKIRAGWGQINASNGKLNNKSVVQQGVKALDKTWSASLISNVQQISSSPSTPLRGAVDSVGAYFQLTDAQNPWLTTPGDAGSGILACRRSVNVLMTDGYYNDSYSGKNVDATDGPDFASANPTGATPTRYVAQLPYKDSYASTLADVSMKYYVDDLQPTVENRVGTMDGDIAFWQHLTQFTVGLGVKGRLDSSTPEAKRATLTALKAGVAPPGRTTVGWPDPNVGNPEKIDDLWHAAVNTGGDFYSVRNVSELTVALADAFGRAAGAEAKEAGVAVTSNSVVAGQLKLVPKYRSASWNGDLDAYVLDATGSPATGVPQWTASTAVPKWADRKLYTWDGGKAIAFTPATLDSATAALVGSATAAKVPTGTKLVDYIRGDDSDEGLGYEYRARGGKVLGDFVNSPPVYVKDLVDLKYDSFDPSYTSYLAAKKARSVGLVVQGGNAGVMHAFNASTGAELFGFLPRAGLPNLGYIAAKDYGTPSNYHRFFVDGVITETDAFIATRRNASPAWSNLLVGAMGAGGRSIFALHVDTTNPTLLDDKTVLWEKSSADVPELGYVVSPMAAGKVKGGGWRLFVGNGAESASGHASLLVFDLATGALVETLVVDGTSGNGLMGVTLINDPSTQEVIGAYAGDLKGNLWRFDFVGGSSAVGFGGRPLVSVKSAAGDAQPISVAPTVIPNQGVAGSLVLFGTGRLITAADAADTTGQSFYAVLDPTKVGASSQNDTSPFYQVDPRTVLAPRFAASTPTPIAGISKQYFAVTGAPIDWTTQKGWYMDMPFSRQRNIYPPLILMQQYLFMQTMLPAADAVDCGVSSGQGYNYVLMAASGSQVDSPVFDSNGDGIIDASDTSLAGFATRADGLDKVICDAGGNCVDESATSKELMKLPPPPPTQTCMELNPGHPEKCKDCLELHPNNPEVCQPHYNATQRVWRQIVNPPTN